jgi:hypothetical protein
MRFCVTSPSRKQASKVFIPEVEATDAEAPL